jgi:acyl-CoA synthetase (AMP-forming)/AMP-acid ligase II
VKTWDLSSVRILFNGAEPISVTIMRAFLDGLAPFGLNPAAMFPAYGLAEATLAVTFPEPDTGASITSFNRMKLIREGTSEEVDRNQPEALELVALGRPLEPGTVMVADRNFRPVADGQVGEVLVKGNNITGGYYNNDNETVAAFYKDWLITGDLGFQYQGQLYITGRSKDIIFMNGANYYAHDIEHMASRMDGILPGRIVVAGWFDDTAGRDRLLVFLVAANQAETLQVCQRLKNHLSVSAGINPELFILLRSADIPRTSSGKIQRFKLVERFLRNEFSDILSV